jgi:DNA-binding MarR family transcriptional regulator
MTPDAVAARVWQGMRALVLDRYDRRKEVCAALDLSFIRVKALRQLAGEALTMGQLADRLATDAPYTTVVVDDLERRGLAMRSPHPTDRRSRVVSVTPAGRAAAATAERILGAPPAALCALAPDELAALDALLAKLLVPPPPADLGEVVGQIPRVDPHCS